MAKRRIKISGPVVRIGDLASEMGITRQGVHHLIRKEEIHVEHPCDRCGAELGVIAKADAEKLIADRKARKQRASDNREGKSRRSKS